MSAVSVEKPTAGKTGPVTRLPAEPLRLDRLIRAGTAYSMTGAIYRSIGLRGPEIAAVSVDPGGLDDLAGTTTVVVDAGDLTLLPALADSHEHLMEASRNTLLVPVEQARSIAEFTAMVATAARDAAPGVWILTSMAWHESNLAENRMPTIAELDAAAPGHPVLARRGGHLGIASTAALTAAGIGPGTPDPPSGKFGRRPDAARTACWKAAPCGRSRPSHRPHRGPSSRAPSRTARPRTRPSGWAPSARP